jgi:cell shape-determining protein MreC
MLDEMYREKWLVCDATLAQCGAVIHENTLLRQQLAEARASEQLNEQLLASAYEELEQLRRRFNLEVEKANEKENM